MPEDYRNTKYCPLLSDITTKKDDLSRKIQSKHMGQENMYKYISPNQSNYKRAFMQIYNYKCSYCGVSIDVIPKSAFEIDHFIYQKSHEFVNQASASHIDNLVLSCRFCNRSKHSFLVDRSARELLHPDLECITNSFYRDNMFYIKIADEMRDNEYVSSFYKKIKFGAEIHRLDYLLMSMMGLQKEQTGNELVYYKLSEAIRLLQTKRNPMV